MGSGLKFFAMEGLQEKLGKLGTAEERISLCLEQMRKSLSESQIPRFKEFWDAKNLCLPIFKEGLPPSVRSRLWSEYVELSTEVRRLKEILDEQSAFAVEQIDLAIAALEKDVEQYDQSLEGAYSFQIPEECSSLRKKGEFYSGIQRELNLLNRLAAQVNAMRKEVMKTEMRIRHKNKFFERLSKVGNKIFPRRKDLIKQVSTDFAADIQAFAQANFAEEKTGEIGQGTPLFALREEIKALQYLAKELTLDTHSFTKTRLELSRLWDLLKEKEKDRRKESAEKRDVYKKNLDLVIDKIKPFAEKCKNENFSMEEAAKQTNEINSFMKEVELGRDEVRLLKDELQKARQPVHDRMRAGELAREKTIQDAHRQKREKFELVQKQIEELLSKIDTETIETLISERERVIKEIEELSLSSAERDILDHRIKKVRDRIHEKKEKSLSAADLRSLEELRRVLGERKLQRQEVKTHLEAYRRALSGSGFDFEKAMRYRELLDEEKARLEKINEAIDEIEDKITDFED